MLEAGPLGNVADMLLPLLMAKMFAHLPGIQPIRILYLFVVQRIDLLIQFLEDCRSGIFGRLSLLLSILAGLCGLSLEELL